MKTVVFTALIVGGATILGATIGFLFKDFTKRFSNTILAFAAGVMLQASLAGLILPSMENGKKGDLVLIVAGIFCGALILELFERGVLLRFAAMDKKRSEVGLGGLLFVFAIAVHNFPEGVAAGVGFGAEEPHQALLIAGGIALQNIPEGMVVIAPMLQAGFSYRKAFILAAFTGVLEVAGTFCGYLAVHTATILLPFALCFAGGTMLYVISDEMIPGTHQRGNGRSATYALLFGVCTMIVCDVLLM